MNYKGRSNYSKTWYNISMTIPKKLKIGIHTYKVLITDTDGCDGKLDREKGEIHINKHLMESEQYTTLLHEILHAVNNELSEKDVEFLAQALSPIIKQL